MKAVTSTNSRVRRMAHEAAEQMETMELNWGTVNLWTIAAACTYMASHLEVRPKTFEEVSRMSGVPPSLLDSQYLRRHVPFPGVDTSGGLVHLLDKRRCAPFFAKALMVVESQMQRGVCTTFLTLVRPVAGSTIIAWPLDT